MDKEKLCQTLKEKGYTKEMKLVKKIDMKKVNNLGIIKNIYFKFIAWNLPIFRASSKLIVFNFSDLLNKGIMQTVLYERKYSKAEQKRKLAIGIITGQISIMRLDLNSETKYKHIRRILK